MAKIPDFQTLDEAVKFWESRDSSKYWGDMEEAHFEVELRQNLLHPKLVVLASTPADCPRCHSQFDDIVIEYVTLQDEQLVVIRDVSALRCQASGHVYLLEDTFDQIVHLLELEETQQLQPVETIPVPVFSLKMTA